MPSIQSILAVFSSASDEMPMLETACELATAHQAHLNCMYVTFDPAYIGLHGAEIMMATHGRNEQKEIKQAKQHIKDIVERHRIPLQDAHESPPSHHQSASFIHHTGNVERIVAEEGRVSDLVVMQRSLAGDNSLIYDMTLSAALFDTARPILLIPEKKPALPLDHTIMVAWNGSRESAVAVAAAMPFLSRAAKVHIVAAREHHKPANLASEKKIMTYLKLHDVLADVSVIDKVDKDSGSVLLAKAQELKAGLVVMGAYGHSRFREMVLGGVTQHMLKHADIPMLLAH